MLQKNIILETVTFCGSSDAGYQYPEISGYGDNIPCTITHHHNKDIDESVTVKIGEYMFTPETLSHVLEQVAFYKKAAKQFPEGF